MYIVWLRISSYPKRISEQGHDESQQIYREEGSMILWKKILCTQKVEMMK